MTKDEQISEEFKERYLNENTEYFQKMFGDSEFGKMIAEELGDELIENPRFWFPEKIEELLENDFRRMGFIASNVYAESIAEFWLDRMNKLRHKKGMISKTEKKKISGIDYSDKLSILRDFDMVDENKYRLLTELNKARNKFAHDVESHSPSNQTHIEEELDNEDLVELVNNLWKDYQEGFKKWLEDLASNQTAD